MTLPHGQPHEGLRRITEYTGYLRELAQTSRDELLGEALRDMARFRNRLVHLYWDVDADTLYELLQTKPVGFDRLSECFLRDSSGRND